MLNRSTSSSLTNFDELWPFRPLNSFEHRRSSPVMALIHHADQLIDICQLVLN
eukprot:Pgem_evm1s20245